MLFMYIHTHPVEKCLSDRPQEAMKLVSQVQEESKKVGVKNLATYMNPHEHTIYSILEANDAAALEKALHPMIAWGNGRLIPVMTMEPVPKIATK